MQKHFLAKWLTLKESDVEQNKQLIPEMEFVH